MIEIHEQNNSLEKTGNQQNHIQNTSSQEEIAAVLQPYLDNPAMVMVLVQDHRTPPAIIQQIALNQTNRKAQALALARIVDTKDIHYSADFFNHILTLCDMNDKNFWGFLPEMFIIILKGKNTPLETLDLIFQSLRNNRPTKLGLSKAEQVLNILNMIVRSRNVNITSGFLSDIEREITHVKSLFSQREQLKASKVQKIYTSSSGGSNEDPVGRINYTHGNAYGKAK